MGIKARYRAHAERSLATQEAVRTEPLRTEQHILHLLLTIFTGGLWLPVWIYRARKGNPVS